MLQLTTKWMTNTLAKKSIQTNDFIECVNESKLYILSYGAITNSGKNTYNYRFVDSEGNESEGTNAYLDALTKIILGTSPKAKANKDANESETTKETKAKKQTKNEKECLYLTFDEAFNKACNMVESCKHIAIMLGKYETKDVSLLALQLINEATIKEHQRIKEAKKNEEMQALLVSLDIAKNQGNAMIIDAINEMIANKEKE